MQIYEINNRSEQSISEEKISAYKGQLSYTQKNTDLHPKKEAFLGIYANFPANQCRQGFQDNSIQLEKRIQNRIRAYTLKAVSAEIVNTIPSYKKDKFGHCRLWHCGRTPKQKTEYVDLVMGKKGKPFFSGLQHCGNCWGCPVCVFKIEEQRVQDVYDSLLQWRLNEYTVHFGALTIPHYAHEGLKINADFLVDSFEAVRKDNSLRKYTVPCLRSFETRYGKNGHHPHLHPIFCIPPGQENYINIFGKLWCNQLRKNDKKVIAEIAFNCKKWDDDIDTLADYICKWKIGDEVVKGNRKKGKENTFTQFEILELISRGEMFPEAMSTRKTPTQVYKEYMTDIKGRQQLAASRGKQNFWLVKNIKTDAEICVDDKIDELIFRVGYQKFLALGRANKIHEVVSIFERSGLAEVEKFVAGF